MPGQSHPDIDGILVAVVALATAIHHQEFALTLQDGLDGMPGAGTVVDSLAPIGNEGAHALRIDPLAGRCYHHQEALLVHGHEGLAA